MIRLLSGIQETLYLLRSENRRPRDWLDEILVVLGVGAALITISFSGHSGSFSLSRFALPLVIMPIVGAISMLLVTLTRRRTRWREKLYGQASRLTAAARDLRTPEAQWRTEDFEHLRRELGKVAKLADIPVSRQAEYRKKLNELLAMLERLERERSRRGGDPLTLSTAARLDATAGELAKLATAPEQRQVAS